MATLRQFTGDVGRRIAHARKQLQLSQAALAERVGVMALTVSKWERGAQTPSMYVNELSRALNVSLSWLVDGKETVYENPHYLKSRQEELAKLFPEKGEDYFTPERIRVIDDLRGAFQLPAKVKPLASPMEQKRRNWMVPLLGYVAAGAGANIGDLQDAEEFARVPADITGADYALRVIGDSMEPNICHGDLVYCMKADLHLPPIEDEGVVFQVPFEKVKPFRGQILVCSVNGDGILKRLIVDPRRDGGYNCRFISLNPRHAPRLLGPKDDFRVQGVATGLFRSLSHKS